MTVFLLLMVLMSSSDDTAGMFSPHEDGDQISIHKYKRASSGSTDQISGSKRTTSQSSSAPIDPCADASVASVLLAECDSAVFCPDPAVISPESLATVEDQYFPRSGRIQVGERRVSLCTRRSPTSNQPQLPDLVEEQWRQIQLPAPVIEVQPADHRTLVNLDTYTQAPQETFRHTTTLLGQQVDIRANATMWHWDLGDGSPVISEDHPGTAFPDPAGYFHYRQPGNYTITLTIDWEAEFSADQGGTWQTIPGTGQTTASLNIEVGEHRPRLQYNP